MAEMTYQRLRERVEKYVLDDRRFQIQPIIDTADTFLVTLANDQLFVIVSIGPSPMADSCLIDVHAGGAYGVTINNQVLEILVTSSWRFDFGGLWCRMPSPQLATPAPGTLNFGWRLRLPSQLFGEANSAEALGFLGGSIELIGSAAATLAREVRPWGGGQPIRDGDADAWRALVGGLVAPSSAE
jgi:hypothetical protein